MRGAPLATRRPSRATPATHNPLRQYDHLPLIAAADGYDGGDIELSGCSFREFETAIDRTTDGDPSHVAHARLDRLSGDRTDEVPVELKDVGEGPRWIHGHYRAWAELESARGAVGSSLDGSMKGQLPLHGEQTVLSF